ncbi:MAG: hypothetical protein QGH59_00810 [Gemmatimonadota bacterium]|nr:hypothetical protein [Gemmatimonadota bacterium]
MGVQIHTYALTDLERVKRHLEIPAKTGTHDAELISLINEGSAWVERYCGRKFLSRTYTHDGSTLPRLDSFGGADIYLENTPVTSVTTLKINEDASALTEGWDQDFVVNEDTGHIHLRTSAFWDRRAILEVTYVGGYLASGTDAQLERWGWSYAAADLEHAVMRLVAHMWRGKDRERDGIASRSGEGMTVSYFDDIPREVREILNGYRRVTL